MRCRRLCSLSVRISLHFSVAVLACSAPDASLQDGDAPVGSGPSPDPSAAGSGGSEPSGHGTPGAGMSDTGTLGDGTPGEQTSGGGAPGAVQSGEAVRLRFVARVADEPFACGTAYRTSSGQDFTPVDLRLFVQDVALIDAAGVEQPVLLDVRPPWQIESVALIDFEDASAGCLAGTRERNLEVSGRVPPGDYRGIAFSNGVPEQLNHADPSRLPPPLQAGSMSWGWLQGYRFLMAEIAGTGAVGDAAAPGSALLHVGSTACSGNPSAGGIACNKQNRNRVRLLDFDVANDAVVVDLAALFGDIDLASVTTCHSSGDDCGPLFERIGIELDSGAASDGQQVYRVEPAGAVQP